MSARTRVERLRAAGGYDGEEWGEPSTTCPPGYSFAGTGALNTKTHICKAEAWQNEALCGVAVRMGAATSLDTLIERLLCMKCLRELEGQR